MPGGSCPGIPVGGKPGWGRRKNNPVWRQTLATRRGFVPQEGARNRERRLRPRFPEIEKAARRAAAKPEQGRGLITSFCSENKKMSEQSGLCSDMARPRGVEPPAYRLGGGRSIQLSYGRIKQASLIVTQNPPAVNGAQRARQIGPMRRILRERTVVSQKKVAFLGQVRYNTWLSFHRICKKKDLRCIPLAEQPFEKRSHYRPR